MASLIDVLGFALALAYQFACFAELVDDDANALYWMGLDRW